MVTKMVRRMNRIFLRVAVALVILLVPFSLSAAGETPAAEEEVMEISWEGRIKTGEDTTWAHEWVNERHNVNIVPNGIGANDDKELVQLMLASGEFPDIGNYWVNTKKIYDDGVIRSIPFDLIRENAPNYTKILDENPLGWLMNRVPGKDDEHMLILGYRARAPYEATMNMFRADWAENVGMPLPDYEKNRVSLDYVGQSYFLDLQTDLDWWERLLVAFKNEDPDGNGKDDTIPWAGCKEARHTWTTLRSAFGVQFGHGWGNMLVDGELYDWRIAPTYKEFLRLAARWYEMGLIDKEYMNLEYDQYCEKLRTGKTAVAEAYIRGVNPQGYAGSIRPPDCQATPEEVAAGASVVCVPGPVGPDGFQGSNTTETGPYHSQVYIGAHVSDEKLAKILQILDDIFFTSEVENWIIRNYGKEGVHFEWSGEAWNSQPIRAKKEDVPAGYPKEGRFISGYPSGDSMAMNKFIYSAPVAKWFNDFYFNSPRGKETIVTSYKVDLFGETEFKEVRKQYGDTLDRMHDEFYMKVVTGQLDLDAEWDDYVAEFRKNGGDALMAELNKAPILSEALKGNIVY